MPGKSAPLVEIACDESGSEGEKLVGGNTAVFAHASVSIGIDAADACVQELRRRIKSPATEYKANHLLREKHRASLLWFLGPSGPIYRHARVYLVQKTYFLVGSLVHMVVPPNIDRSPDEDALVLHRDAPVLVDPADWLAFLESSNQLLWDRDSDVPRPTSTEYTELLDRMRRAAAGHPAGNLVEDIWTAGAAMIAASENHVTRTSSLDPLVPALARAVESWAEGGQCVSITHDEQSTITDDLIAELHQASAALTSVRLVDSMDDRRVQVADFLAGVARRIAEDALTGNGDDELITLLRPYIDPLSIWGDTASWAALKPGDHLE